MVLNPRDSRVWRCCLISYFHRDVKSEASLFDFIKVSIDSSAPGRCGNNSKTAFAKHMLHISVMSTSCEIDLRWIPENIFHDKSTLV